MTGNDIRSMFLEFFKERDHRVVRSSSLVPANDPTLLFANAGMNQFKDVFLGLEQRDYRRAASCQKCVRAGGKHNDLENVGFTNRHHTFFEMLGNFSFGDYFKKDAIVFAWELLTGANWFAIPKDKLYVTIFKGESGVPRDVEAGKAWLAQGVAAERIFELGAKDNFWAMGETGPCGPCSEIHYDMGPAASDQGHGLNGTKECEFGCECGRYVEIWNLVFMQFNRDAEGKLNPLPRPSVDTGAGLERLAAVLQGKISNFNTDLFIPLIREAEKHVPAKYGRDPKLDPSFRIVADHARATTFLIADGVIPSNEGRGYVLRKIMRRGMRHARLLGPEKPFFTDMVVAVRDLMGGAYPELLGEAGAHVLKVVAEEENRFHHTIEVGLKKLEEGEIARLLQLKRDNPGRPFKFFGDQAFKFYDTYGLPLDFIVDVVRDAGIELEQSFQARFDNAMQEQRTRAKASWKGTLKAVANPAYAKLAETFRTEPDFYFGTATSDCRVEAIVTKEGAVNEIRKGQEAEIVLDRTAIYAESGGQVADTGGFYDDSGSLQLAEVRGAYYPVAGLVAHRILAKEDLQVGDRLATVADADRRAHNMRNHSATHLMHAALRNILGTHVKQAGSLVAPDHLRFDFSHFAAVDSSELADIEQQVNEQILKNLELRTDIMNIDDALSSGALAFFGDKYPESNVRVVTIADPASPRGFYSKELCGGTHVGRTGEIGMFKIVGEQSVAAGVRRVEAISGDRALADYQRALGILRSAASLLNSSEDGVLEAIERQLETAKQLEKQLDALKRKSAGSLADDLLEGAREVKGVRVLAAQVPGYDRAALRQLVDVLRQKLGSGVVVLAAAEDGKVALITGVTKDLISKLHAGKIVQELAKLVGGSGGGKPDLAEAGGKDTSAIEIAIGHIYPLLDRLL
jgi:alanyl-tRNA synthetase